MSQHKFVVSPLGYGQDCHRTWEALAVGSIPIVRASNLASMFYRLPILVVNGWQDVTPKLLARAERRFRRGALSRWSLLSTWIQYARLFLDDPDFASVK